MEDDIGDALPVVQGRDDEKIVNSSVRDDNSDGKSWCWHCLNCTCCAFNLYLDVLSSAF